MMVSSRPVPPLVSHIHLFHLIYLTLFTSYLVSSLCTKFRPVRYITAADSFVIFHLNRETNAERKESERRGAAVFSAAHSDTLLEIATVGGQETLVA